MRLIALTTLALLLAAGLGHAQPQFPGKTVRVVVPYPAGGGTDVLGRLLADQLARKWGQSAIVENSGGAAGNIGAAEVFRAPPDGHTMMIAAPGPIATNSFLYKDMPFDPRRWSAIALLTTGPYVLVLRKSFEGSNVNDLIARAKTDRITAAIPGVGSIAHLATVQLEMLAGIKTTQVPYRGLSPAINDLIAGHVDLMFDTPTTALPLHRDGKVKIIATGTPTRLPEASDIPSLAEAGVSGYRAITWYALVGPPNMPAPLIARINRDVAEILSRADVVERVRAIQMEPSVRTPEQSAAFFADESELWGKVIKQANIPLQ
jgi:tripartite-type tricarboxylate transporter receptor subunit TctC